MAYFQLHGLLPWLTFNYMVYFHGLLSTTWFTSMAYFQLHSLLPWLTFNYIVYFHGLLSTT